MECCVACQGPGGRRMACTSWALACEDAEQRQERGDVAVSPDYRSPIGQGRGSFVG